MVRQTQSFIFNAPYQATQPRLNSEPKPKDNAFSTQPPAAGNAIPNFSAAKAFSDWCIENRDNIGKVALALGTGALAWKFGPQALRLASRLGKGGAAAGADTGRLLSRLQNTFQRPPAAAPAAPRAAVPPTPSATVTTTAAPRAAVTPTPSAPPVTPAPATPATTSSADPWDIFNGAPGAAAPRAGGTPATSATPANTGWDILDRDPRAVAPNSSDSFWDVLEKGKGFWGKLGK